MDERRAYFDATAEAYLRAYTAEGDLGQELAKRYLDYLLPLAPGHRMLEVGCGPGTFLASLRPRSPLVVGTDFSGEMLRLAKARGGDRLVQADGRSLPFPDAAFEVVYSIRCLQHIPGPDKAIREISRVLVPGGFALLDLMNLYNPFGFFRSIFWRPFERIRLSAFRPRRMLRFCRESQLALVHAYPVQMVVDAANLAQYFPGAAGRQLVRLFRVLDFIPREGSPWARIALRLLLLLRKLDPH